MRRIIIFALLLAGIGGMTACSAKGTETPIQSTQTGETSEKSWTEQDILEQYDCVKEKSWQEADCVVFPDRSCGHIGAVLFWDDERQTSNTVYFGADGSYQQCGTEAKLAAEPNLTYLGAGTVTYGLQTEDGTEYHYTVTITSEDGNEYCTVKDDLDAIQQQNGK